MKMFIVKFGGTYVHHSALKGLIWITGQDTLKAVHIYY
jgi:hypothetical protein